MSLSQVKAKPYDSHFWRGLMKIKDEVVGVYRQACSGMPLVVRFVGRDRRL